MIPEFPEVASFFRFSDRTPGIGFSLWYHYSREKAKGIFTIMVVQHMLSAPDPALRWQIVPLVRKAVSAS